MARIVNEQEYKQKRNEILDTAQKLVYTIGYEKMTIQDILDELKMSKGAFYHYFKSKDALLEALVIYMMEGVNAMLEPIAADPTKSGIEKLNIYFSTAASWKTARKPFFKSLIQSWYSDGNIIVREKTQAATFKRILPYVNQMIKQAVAEGSMDTPYPELAGDMIFNIFMGLGESMVEFVLDPDSTTDFEFLFYAYTNAIERVLGAKPGSIIFLDPEILAEWRELPSQPE